MAAPDYVPVSREDRVRPADRIPPPAAWMVGRPGEMAGLRPPSGPGFGVPGPDQGYGLKLARRFVNDLRLADHEHAEDAVQGCLGVALRRASLFGRAPVIHDFELAYRLFGFLGDAPTDLVEYRKELFAEAAHDYARQRDIVDRVEETTLRMTPAAVAERIADWRSLISG